MTVTAPKPKPDMHTFSVPRSALCIFPQVLEEYALHTMPDLPSGSVIIDLGANNGAFTWFALARYAGSRVIAVEPHPVTVQRLRGNMKGLPVEIMEGAVVHPKKAATAKLFEGLHADTEASLRDDVRWPHVSQDLEHSHEVPLIDAADLPPCELLKVDTEGNEVPILEGYRFLKDVEILLVEGHAVGGDLQGQLNRIAEIAIGAGFTLVGFVNTTLRFVRHPADMKVAATPSAAAAAAKLATIPEGDWYEVETTGGSLRLARVATPPFRRDDQTGLTYFEPSYKMTPQRFFVPIPAPGSPPRILPIDLPAPVLWMSDGSGEWLDVSAMRPLPFDRARAIVGAQG